MSQFNRKTGFSVGRRTVVIGGSALVAVLLGTNLLLYYNVFAPVSLPDAAEIRIPALASPRPAAAGPPAGPQAVDANYRRAVTSQLAQISADQQRMLGITPTPVAPKLLSPTPVRPVPAVTLVVNTAGVPLNVRAQPGTSAPVIGSLAPGTPLAAVGINPQGDWILAHIPNQGEPGWIFAGLVRVTAGALSTLPQIDPDLSQE